jgi:hypothetical protein
LTRKESIVLVVFDGRMDVAYMQAYVEPLEGGPEVNIDEAFRGQANGLLGAAQPGALRLTTGLTFGDVGFRLVIADQAPPLGADWEDVVEVPFVPAGPSCVSLQSGEVLCEFELQPVPHRVRYSARGMDAAQDYPVVAKDDPLVDHYELTFWPADPAPDEVVRRGSRCAAYWHDARNPVKSRTQTLRKAWDEKPPSDGLIAPWLTGRAPGLVEALSAAEPGIQRAVAHWAARRACEQAGIDRLDWVAVALGALDRDEELPPPFDEPAEVYARMNQDGEFTRTTVTLDGQDGVDCQGQALFTLLMADTGNPLDAALDTLTEATSVFGDEQRTALLDELPGVLAGLTRNLTAGQVDGHVPDTRDRSAVRDPEVEDADTPDIGVAGRMRLIWGEEVPSPRLVEVYAVGLTRFDRVLAERLAAADPQTQRSVARWAARRACTAAGLTDALPEVALALDHLDRGEALPPPFDQEEGEWTLLEGDEAYERVIVCDGQPNCSRWHYAIPALRQAAEPDPLRAAAHALWTAASSFGDSQRPLVLTEAATQFLAPFSGDVARGWY